MKGRLCLKSKDVGLFIKFGEQECKIIQVRGSFSQWKRVLQKNIQIAPVGGGNLLLEKNKKKKTTQAHQGSPLPLAIIIVG